MFKKIFLSLLMVISFLFMSGFTTLAESKTNAQEYPSGLYKATFERFQYIQENTRTHEYVVYYVVPFIINETISENDYYFINNINEAFRKGINRNTNSYILESQSVDSVNGQTWFFVRVTVLETLLDSKYPDGMVPLFENDTAFYININLSGINEYERGYKDGYNEGYEDGLKDVDVTDYFGERNMVNVPGINNAESPLEFNEAGLATLTVTFNRELSGESITAYPNIVLDQPYMVLIINRVYYDSIKFTFEGNITRYYYDGTRCEIGEYDIYAFDFSDLLNKKYYLQIIKYDINNYQQYFFYYFNIVDTLYFSHTSKLLNSDQVLKFYELGYLKGLEEQLRDEEVYQVGYENGYDRGYKDGHDIGYDKGYEDGHDTGYGKGYTIGNNEGYENGYETGYNKGFNDGKTADYDKGYNDGYKQGREDGYNRGVKDGYQQGSNDGFLNDVSKWFGPMVLIVLIAGAYVTLKNRRSGD